MEMELSEGLEDDRLVRVDWESLRGTETSWGTSCSSMISRSGSKGISESRTETIELRGRGIFSGSMSLSASSTCSEENRLATSVSAMLVGSAYLETRGL